MANVVTINSTAQSFTLSNTAYGALSNSCLIHYGAVTNVNLQFLMASYLAQGLRNTADNRMGGGQITTGGMTVSYLEGTLIPNSE